MLHAAGLTAKCSFTIKPPTGWQTKQMKIPYSNAVFTRQKKARQLMSQTPQVPQVGIEHLLLALLRESVDEDSS